MLSPLRSCGAWSFALLRKLRNLRGLRCSSHVARCFPSCVVTSFYDSADDFRSTAQDSPKTLLLSCHHNSFLDTWWRSRCFYPYCRTEELWLIWPYGGGIWKHVDAWETSRAQWKFDRIQVCLQVVFWSSGTNHRSRRSQACPR